MVAPGGPQEGRKRKEAHGTAVGYFAPPSGSLCGQKVTARIREGVAVCVTRNPAQVRDVAEKVTVKARGKLDRARAVHIVPKRNNILANIKLPR